MFLSDQQRYMIEKQMASSANKKEQARVAAMIKAGEVKDGLELLGAAATVGFIRGKLESKGHSMTIPSTNIDIGALVGLGLVGAGLLDLCGSFDDDALMVGYGVLCPYIHQVSRNLGRTGKFSLETLVAGDEQFIGQLPGEGAYGLPGMPQMPANEAEAAGFHAAGFHAAGDAPGVMGIDEVLGDHI